MISRESLYRLYRPQTFADVAGQSHVTKPLSDAIAAGKIAHAYLFAGSRGLGKTSVARILARAVGASERDTYEMDAASRNSVEDIRELAENVYTLPFESSLKVYILDEAHMLSKSAWNAFLKTLEEPPAHVIFILATTELERVPETVRSRCQVFEFQKPSRSALAEVCVSVAKKEGYALAPDAAELIAMLAEGSYRDALSILQKALGASKDKKITRAEAEAVTGAPKRAYVHDLLAALAEGKRDAALAAMKKASASGADMKLFLELVTSALRSILLIRLAPDLRRELSSELGADEYAAYENFAKGNGITHHALFAFLSARERIAFSPVPEIPLELAVYELFGSQ